MTGDKVGAAIEASEIRFAYEGGPDVLTAVDVSIAAGEFVALVGQNGSGKTTLAKQFNGILRPTAGRVAIDGHDIAGRTTTELSRSIGYCYQNPDHQIFASSVRAELEFGPRNLGVPSDEVHERTSRLLALVGLEAVADSYPFGLSRGERQKVAVASVLAMEPRVVIVDEPTTGLDWRGGRSMMEIIRQMHLEGRTIIVITHDMHLVAEYAQRVIVMANGSKVADGPPRSVFGDERALREAALRPPQIYRLSLALPHLLGQGALTVAEAEATIRSRGTAIVGGEV